MTARARRSQGTRSMRYCLLLAAAFIVILTNPAVAINPIKKIFTTIFMGNMATSSASSKMSAKDFIENEVGNNEVVIFSKSYCPYCVQTKQTFKGPVGQGHTVKVFELDEMDNGGDLQRTLLQMSGQRTVPNVWIKGKHLGGNDDTQNAAASGKLQELLSK